MSAEVHLVAWQEFVLIWFRWPVPFLRMTTRTGSPALSPARCQMRVSTLSARWFGFSLLLIAGTVGCAQSETGDPASLTAPSAVTPPTSAQGAPTAYDASGTWHVSVVISSHSGEVLLTDEGDNTLTQDADGNLSANTEDGGQVTMVRRGKGFGAKVTYDISTTEPSSSGCPEDLTGVGQIDVATNTLTARLTGVLEGCQNNTVVMSITATKTGV
jgi:hypothetical protein